MKNGFFDLNSWFTNYFFQRFRGPSVILLFCIMIECTKELTQVIDCE